MDTEILKLDPPYNYIYCNGSIGLHIATLIVYEAKTNENGEYQLETHSHPIVKYSERPGGTVWNRAELTDCNVLCSEADKRVSMAKFFQFTESVQRARLMEISTEDDCAVIVNAPMWKSVFDANGIEIDWPMIDECGRKKPQDEFCVHLNFQRNPKWAKTKYKCYSDNGSDTVFTGAIELYVYAEFNNKRELEMLLTNFMRSYYYAFRDRLFTIEFKSSSGSEFDKVLEKINSQELSIRMECNDIDV